MTRLHAVVLAGGGGSRLWPISRRLRPKQVLHLSAQRSLFAEAISRLTGWIPPEQITVATTPPLADLLAKSAPELPQSSFLLEPEPKGTAPVLGLAAADLRQRDPSAVMAVLTSDHAIESPARLRSLLEAGAELAAAGHIVTLGIPPTVADTGYGYIRRGALLSGGGGERAYLVRAFKEKPDARTAQRYVEEGDYYWNSGMFLWTPERLLDEIARHMPDLHRLLTGRDFASRGEPEAFARAWSSLKPQTIDYAVMEQAADVVVLDAAGLGWTDVGSWDRVHQLLQKDDSGNAVLGAQAFLHESDGNLVVGEGARRLIVLSGVEGLVVVDTGDVLLVCRLDQAGRVRQIVDELDRRELDQYLV
jgi:mannose-1-phosphate guanylyltransferase